MIMNPIPEFEQDVIRAVEVLIDRERHYEHLSSLPIHAMVGADEERHRHLEDIRRGVVAARGHLRKTWDALVEVHAKQIAIDEQGRLDAAARR